jgi:hypothetical protein
MKKIALISTFCNTEEKQNLLKENIDILKNQGLDVMCLSPNFIQLPHDIIQKSDFVFYTKENPLLSWPEKSWTFWKTINTDKGWMKITTFKSDYGWADLYQRKKLTEIALTFDYDIFYHLIYDSEINEDVIEEIRNNKINKINPCVKGNNSDFEWDTSLQFMVFDRVLMEKILKELTLEEYLSSNGAAEGEVLKWKEKFNIPTEGAKVKDRIFNYKDTDLYNYSQDDNYKFFVNKNEKYGIYEPELQVIIYDIKLDGNLILEINNVEYNYNLNVGKNKLIKLDIHCNDIEKFIITFNGDNHNFTETYLNVIRNYIHTV